MEDNVTTEEKLHDTLMNERDNYNKILSEESDKYDKNIVLVSSGSFVISFSFLRNIVPAAEEVIGTQWIIVIGWAAMIASLLAILLSFLFSQDFQRQRIAKRTKQMKNIDRARNADLPLNLYPFKRRNATFVMNYLSFIFLVAGLFFFVLYLWKNLVSK